MQIKRMKKAKEIPSGYRGLGVLVHETDKAGLFQYYEWQLWIPKKVLVRVEDNYFCPAPCVETAKQYVLSREIKEE